MVVRIGVICCLRLDVKVDKLDIVDSELYSCERALLAQLHDFGSSAT
jgi:hypothetical protein